MPTLNQYNDVIDIGSIGGTAEIDGGMGNDDFRVNYNQDGTQTFANGIAGTLTLMGNKGSDLFEIGLSGQPGPTGALKTVIG